MLRYFFISFLFIVIAVVALAGFRGTRMAHPPIEILPDMDHQPKYQPQHGSTFWADGRAARKPVEGTVPMGYQIPGSYLQTGASNSRAMEPTGFTDAPNYYNTGKTGDLFGTGLPIEVSPAVIKLGQERYMINCAPCHAPSGQGNGIIGQYGLVGIADLHQERIRKMPDGEIFDTITNGKNTMGAYGPQIAVEDRWSIVAYVRALQLSQNMEAAKLPAELRSELETK